MRLGLNKHGVLQNVGKVDESGWLETMLELLHISNLKGWYIPETLVFQWRKAYRLYYSDSEGRVKSIDMTKKKSKDMVDLHAVFLGPGMEDSEAKRSVSSISTYYVYTDRELDLIGKGKPRIEYMNALETEQFLNHLSGRSNNGILQRFLDPPSSTPSQVLIRYLWTPHLTHVESRINMHNLKDRRINPEDVVTTFDGQTMNSKECPISNTIMKALNQQMDSFVKWLRKSLPKNLEPVALQMYFKPSASTRYRLQWCAGARFTTKGSWSPSAEEASPREAFRPGTASVKINPKAGFKAHGVDDLATSPDANNEQKCDRSGLSSPVLGKDVLDRQHAMTACPLCHCDLQEAGPGSLGLPFKRLYNISCKEVMVFFLYFGLPNAVKLLGMQKLLSQQPFLCAASQDITRTFLKPASRRESEWEFNFGRGHNPLKSKNDQERAAFEVFLEFMEGVLLQAMIPCNTSTIIAKANSSSMGNALVPLCEDCSMVLKNSAMEKLIASVGPQEGKGPTPGMLHRAAQSLSNALDSGKQTPVFKSNKWKDNVLPRLLPDKFPGNREAMKLRRRSTRRYLGAVWDAMQEVRVGGHNIIGTQHPHAKHRSPVIRPKVSGSFASSRSGTARLPSVRSPPARSASVEPLGQFRLPPRMPNRAVSISPSAEPTAQMFTSPSPKNPRSPDPSSRLELSDKAPSPTSTSSKARSPKPIPNFMLAVASLKSRIRTKRQKRDNKAQTPRVARLSQVKSVYGGSVSLGSKSKVPSQWRS